MFCSNCGKEITGNEKFCPHCGRSATGKSDSSASNGASVNANAEPPKIEVFRKFAFYGFLNDLKVYVDGTEIGRIGNGKTKTFTVAPGEHKLKVKVTWWWDHSQEIPFTAENNTTLKFQCGYPFGLLGTLLGWAAFKSLITGGNVIKLEKY